MFCSLLLTQTDVVSEKEPDETGLLHDAAAVASSSQMLKTPDVLLESAAPSVTRSSNAVEHGTDSTETLQLIHQLIRSAETSGVNISLFHALSS